MNNYTRLEHLNAFAELLLENGFTLIVREGEQDSLSTYFHFWKDGNLGYVQSDRFEHSKFSTVHKPCKDYGTGFGVNATGGDYAELTIENALKALVRIPAQWRRHRKTSEIKYYSSPDEYVKSNDILKYKVIQPKNA